MKLFKDSLKNVAIVMEIFSDHTNMNLLAVLVDSTEENTTFLRYNGIKLIFLIA